MAKIPKLITFDGEARSGKGTIVQTTKDVLRDELGFKTMLIDAGQVFRCLVVAAADAGVDLENPAAIDTFLSDDESAQACVEFVKQVYHMDKDERDSLLYTNEVGANSAKVGARPLSQSFKDDLLRKWLHDAANEGYEVVLLDGRALEEAGIALENEQLCDFVMGLYFVCDPIVGARRTLGFATTEYEDLSANERSQVDELVAQINARNEADRNRAVQPIVRPEGAPVFVLPDTNEFTSSIERYMATIDTSGRMTKDEMSRPVAQMVAEQLKNSN